MGPSGYQEVSQKIVELHWYPPCISKVPDRFQQLLKRIHGHRSTCTVVNSDLPLPIPIKSHQLSFQECWFLCIIHKHSDATPTMSAAANQKQYINSFFSPNSFLVSTSGNLTWLPPSPLPFTTLAAPANIMVSLPLQLMKATVLADSSCFHLYLSKL